MKKIFSLTLTLFLLLSLLLTGCCGLQKQAESNTAAMFTVTDSSGRHVQLRQPVKRAVVVNAYNAELINAIGALEQVVGVDYYIYQDQEGFRHRFNKDTLVGQNQGGLNYEKIIALKPDVVIMTGNSGWQEAEKKLRPFGIPVVTVDAYYTGQFAANVRLLGQIFGREGDAGELAAYFTDRLRYIDTQLQNVPRRSVYFEYRSSGKTTVPGDYFYKMVDYAYGGNIFAADPNVNIDIEAVVAQNPQYIVKVSDTDVYSSYLPPTAAEMQKIKSGITSRPGWEYIDAVKNDRILLLSHYAHGGASKLVGTMYIAKFLYPEYLPDLHPEQVFKDWVTKYQHLDYRPGHTDPPFALTD